MSEMIGWWAVTGLVLAGVMLALGVKINGRFLGVLIDSRGKMSLSRLQLVSWTWLLVSCFFAIALARRTTNIEMDEQLWALMGISLASAAGSTLIKGAKEAREPDSNVVNASTVSLVRRGLIQVNSSPKAASFLDMFKGEEIADYSYVDIAKVQMFFFTIAAWAGYAASLWVFSFVPGETGTISFPIFSTSLVTLIGISHAGYLTVKSAPKTPSKI